MSDQSQGPGWWQASDGKWYPPEQAPGGAPQQPGPQPGGGAQPAPAGIDVGSALSYGWNKFTANLGDIVVIWLIVIGVQIVFNVLAQTIGNILISLLFSVVGFIVSIIVQIALVRVGLLITAGQKVTPAAAFSTDKLAPYAVGAILYGLAVFVGFFALCIGAIIVGFLLWFYGYYILDQDQDPVTALKSSFELTTKNFGTVGVFALVAFVLLMVTCGLAAPIVQIGSAYLYRNLNGQAVAP
ncbi:MAG: hypothetical protein JJU45_15710 [Acidimicrobiia bacterium]|nr:hypothetical protein [Acidimicrobiia bacterium]